MVNQVNMRTRSNLAQLLMLIAINNVRLGGLFIWRAQQGILHRILHLLYGECIIRYSLPRLGNRRLS